MALLRGTSLESTRCSFGDYALSCPLLLVHPGLDRWTPVCASMPVFEALPSSKQLVTLSNGPHAPLERPAYDELCAHVSHFVSTGLRARRGHPLRS